MTRLTDDKVILQMLNEGKSLKEIANHFGVSKNAIWKRKQRLLPPKEPEAFSKLTPKQKGFAVAIASGQTQTDSAMASHDCITRDSAKALGHELMARSDIQIAVSELLQQEGLTRRYRVKKLKGHVDHTDPGVSLKALDQSWRLDGAYTEKIEISGPSYENVCREVEETKAELKKLGYSIIEDVIDGEAKLVEDDKEV